MKVVAPPQEGAGQGLGTSIQTLSEILYANDRLVTSPDSARLQGVFDDLKSLFDQVGLRTKEGKTASMVYQSCHTPHSWSMEAYTRKVMGQVISYRERLCQRVHLTE